MSNKDYNLDNATNMAMEKKHTCVVYQPSQPASPLGGTEVWHSRISSPPPLPQLPPPQPTPYKMLRRLVLVAGCVMAVLVITIVLGVVLGVSLRSDEQDVSGVVCVAPRVQYGHAHVSHHHGHDVANYECDAGYTLLADAPASSMCLPDGVWYPPPPNCTVVTCSEPHIVNGYVSGDVFTYLSEVTYHCNTGYELPMGAANTATCQGDGEWNFEPPQCSRISCGEPDISHGYAVGHEFNYEAVVSYQCNKGYRLPVNAPTRGTCQANGHWEPQAQSCTAISCGTPRISHGYAEGHSFTYQAVVSYNCDSGFRLPANAPKRGTCKANGQWKPQPPACTVVPDAGSLAAHVDVWQLGLIFVVIILSWKR